MFDRYISTAVLKRLETAPVVLLQGARQTGKSTLAKTIVNSGFPATYITFDDAINLVAATSDAQDFIARQPLPVILDEVQLVPDIFRAIKLSVDRDRRPGMFLLTGSANVMLLPDLSKALAGRVHILTLWGLSQTEITGHRGELLSWLFSESSDNKFELSATSLPDLTLRMVAGGYPEPVTLSDEDRAAWYGSYLTTVMQRDVRAIAQIDRLAVLPNVLAVMATRLGGLLNASDLSSATGVPLSSLTRYLVLLENIFITLPVRPWSPRAEKRFTKSKKIYLADPGLACHLLGLTNENADARLIDLGRLLENFVLTELVKQASWSLNPIEIFHFRTDKGVEVDFVMEDKKRGIVGVEIKLATVVRQDDLRGLKLLKSIAGDRFVRGIILYRGSRVYSLGENMLAVPLSALWTI